MARVVNQETTEPPQQPQPVFKIAPLAPAPRATVVRRLLIHAGLQALPVVAVARAKAVAAAGAAAAASHCLYGMQRSPSLAANSWRKVVAGVEDVEDLDRIRDPLGGEFGPRVSIRQGSTAGSEMTLV